VAIVAPVVIAGRAAVIVAPAVVVSEADVPVTEASKL
jgi:hypothetical protein